MTEAFVVVGGSVSQLGVFERAKARGHAVCVVDGSERAPLLHAADVGICRSFAEVDAVLGELHDRGVRPVAVATMGSDQAVLPTAQLAAALDLPGLSMQTAEAVSDKRRMRAALAAAGVPCAPARDATSPAEAVAAWEELEPPLVVKPVDGSGQRGVTEVRDRDEVEPALERALAASRRGVAVVERYLEGDEYTVNGFSLGADYRPITVTRRVLHDPPPLGVAMAHRYPSGLSKEQERELFDVAAATCRAVGLETGPSYVQLRLDDGRATVIEIGGRLGGGKDAELAQLVTGFDAIDAAVDAALGQLTREALFGGGDPVAPVGQVRFFLGRPGRIMRLDASPALELEGVQEAGFYWREGMELPPLVSGAERLGYVLVTADTEEELEARTRRAVAALDVETVEEGALLGAVSGA